MNYTNLEQSKRLLSLGLDPDSADKVIVVDKGAEVMFALDLEDEEDYIKYIRSWPNDAYTPCWSFMALLDVLPEEYEFIKNPDGTYEISVGRIAAMVSEGDETAVDLLVNMVVWLLENNYIKHE